MGQITEVKINDAGVQELMNSAGVVSFLDDQGQKMRGSAMAKARGAEYDVTTLPGKTRARCIIITANKAAKKAESESAALRASIDAARTS